MRTALQNYLARRASSKAARKQRIAKSRKMRVPRLKLRRVPQMGMHRFTRMVANSQLITVAAGSTGVAFTKTFTFDELAGYTEFTSLFDQYKIVKVECMYKLHTNPTITLATDNAVLTAAQNLTYPTIYLINDYDDSSAETLAQLKQRERLRRFVLSPNRIIKWTVRPTILAQLYRTVATTGYAPKRYQWIDVANTDVPHYGVKGFVDYDAATNQQQITVNVEYKFHFQLKSVR